MRANSSPTRSKKDEGINCFYLHLQATCYLLREKNAIHKSPPTANPIKTNQGRLVFSSDVTKAAAVAVGVGEDSFWVVGSRVEGIVGKTSVAVRVGVTEPGIGVVVAGGVISNSNFWFGRRSADSFDPFQLIKSLRLTL